MKPGCCPSCGAFLSRSFSALLPTGETVCMHLRHPALGPGQNVIDCHSMYWAAHTIAYRRLQRKRNFIEWNKRIRRRK